MPGIEHRYQKDVDAMILSASAEQLREIQELDLETQMSGDSFYDLLSDSRSVRPKTPGSRRS